MNEAWEHIEIVRNAKRPNINDYISMIFDDFIEFHGDRFYGDDCAIKGGIAIFQGKPVTFIGMVKGKNVEENKKCNFAMPNPEGYRKALRLMKEAEKFHRPVVCMVDTPGANPSIGAEERGQGEAIARNLYELMRLKTPVVSIILGEGGSGGALALAVCDELAMLENAVYSVISPRGFASILWKDGSREKEAAGLLKMTAENLVTLGVCDYIIKETTGGAHTNPQTQGIFISEYLDGALKRLRDVPVEDMLESRYEKFRRIGVFSEADGDI
jgi:acetyl-CoA carboxylase carboxyl transferase subunit alpha